MKLTEVGLDDVDLTDLDAFEHNEAWGMFDTLRREAPVHWNPEPDGNAGFWSLTRHADIVAADKNAEVFTSRKFTNLEEPPAEFQDLRRSMMETDGPRHQALKKLLQRDFSVATLRRYEDFLRGLATLTVERALQQEEFDFVDSIAADYPIAVLARLLDVPEDVTPQLIAWGNEITGSTDPEYARVLLGSPEADKYKHLPFRSPASQEIFDYGRKLADERRGGVGDDLVSKLVNRIPDDGVPMSSTDYDNYFLLLVVAGNETTRQAISHAMKALIDAPEQLEYFLQHPDRVQTAIEELLRIASPVYHFRRTATRDVEMHGRTIRAGDKVVMWFASGNRDETVFTDPYRLDLARYPNDHMTFGKGPHGCLGANLARLELRVMFETLLPRLETIEQTGEIVRVRSNFINGIKRFPVRVKPRATPRLIVPAAPTRVREQERDLVVSSAVEVADGVVSLTLSPRNGAAMPRWKPGAHIDLVLRPDLVRQYSLCGDPADAQSLRIGVLREPAGRGGSQLIHDSLTEGSTVRVRGPRNHFPFVESPRYVFIAGGIGITPILPMIAQANATDADWRLYYAGRSRTTMAYLDELRRYAERVQIYAKDEVGRLDLALLLRDPQPDTAVYCCGPEGLLDAVEELCAAWPEGALHVERFVARKQTGPVTNTEFELRLARSGLTLTVPENKSIFDVVQEAGVSVLGSCYEGICGTCEQAVLDGEVEHRDSVLSSREQAANDTMMICVSRCRSRRLTLDI